MFALYCLLSAAFHFWGLRNSLCCDGHEIKKSVDIQSAIFSILQILFGLLDISQDVQFIGKLMFIFILGEHKLHFIPALIGPFLEVTLIPQPDLRNVMIPIFHDMMDWEQRRSGNFKQVQWVKLFHKMVGIGRYLRRSCSPTPVLK